MKPVAVVIVTYNRRDWLSELLHLLSQQTVLPEVIISDDGSEPLPVLAFPVVSHYLWARHTGYHRVARYNEALRFVTAPAVVLLDDDCLPRAADWLEQHLAALEAADCVRGQFWDQGEAKTAPWFSTTNLALRTPLARQLGPFDMAYDGGYGYEDADLEWGLRAGGARIVVGPAGTAAIHRGLSNPKQHVRVAENLAYYKNKWGL